jgi:anti-sigma B factor antagonist
VTVLGVHTDEGPDAMRVSLEGELDLSNVLYAEEQIRKVEKRKPALVLDLRRLRFLDSTGLRVIVSAHQRAKNQGRRLKIVPGGEAVKRLFRLSGLERRLEFVEEV